MRTAWMAALAFVAASAVNAQPRVEPVPLEPFPLRGSESATTPPPMAPAATPRPAAPTPRPRAETAVSRQTAPPVLPEFPRRRAIEAVAIESGRMTYAGPSGAMSTSANGGTCAVTCSLSPPEEYQVACPAGQAAICQCDAPPYAECRPL